MESPLSRYPPHPSCLAVELSVELSVGNDTKDISENTVGLQNSRAGRARFPVLFPTLLCL